MDDIIDRLKERQKRCKGRAKMELWRLLRDAIDEIKRLRLGQNTIGELQALPRIAQSEPELQGEGEPK